jgi:hypothetical protein
MRKRVGYFVAFLAFSANVTPIAAAPQVAQVDPLALTPGKTTEFTIRGQNLQDARSLWTTFAARCEFVASNDDSSQKGEKLVCRVTVPREEQVGVGALRVVTGAGVSNPLLLMLDDLPTISESPDNHAAEKAQSIPWPIAVDGECDAVQEDFFRVHAAAGQCLSFEVVSQRLGSKLDPVLRLLSADGTEVVRLDDATGSGGDSRFAHTFESDGDYQLALRDVRHAGGSEYRYRLRIGSFPIVTAVYPAGGPAGAVMSFELLDGNASAASPVHVALPDSLSEPRLVSFSVPTSSNTGSGWFQVEANPGNESLEREPNDNREEATAVQVPGAINGRLDKISDRDHFKFHAMKGQRVHFVAKTRELGSACDLYMSLHTTNGSQIAEARQERLTILNSEIPEDGDYVLQVENLLVGERSRYVYRIDASETYSGFTLSAEQTQYTAPQSGTFVVKVLAQRRGYNGPIELAVEGLGEGVKLEGNTFDGAETLLKITLPSSIPQGELRHASIVGKAKVGEQTVSVTANQRELLMSLFPNALSLPTQLEETIAIGVGPPFPPFFDLSLESKQIYFPQLVGASTFDIDVMRTSDAFKDPVSFVIKGLPTGVTAEVAPVEDGSKAYRVTLTGPIDLAEQDVPIRIIGTGKFQEQTRTVVLPDLNLSVTKPLVVSVAMPGPIVAGGEQHAEVRVQRFGDEPLPIRLQVKDGPASLLAPIFVTVPGDANEAKIPLTAAASAPAGTFDNLIVVATTTVKGRNVAVASRPVTVEIQPATTE